MAPRRAGIYAALALASICAVFALALIIAFQLTRVQSVQSQMDLWRDSVAGIVFGFERQFLHFRGELAAAVASDTGVESTRMRYEILVSRIDLLRNSPGVQALATRPEHGALQPLLHDLVRRGDQVMAGSAAPSHAEAVALLAFLDQALPAVQSYTNSAAAVTTNALSEQLSAFHRQAVIVAVMAGIQVLLAVLASRAWWAHERQQQAARQQLEQLAGELSNAKATAEAASRTKSQFLANMSHELRTPFQGVLGMLQILQRSPLRPEQVELVSTVQESAGHLLTVLNEILDVSAIEEGRMTLHETPVDPRALCRDVCGLMSLQAEARGLALRVELAPTLPALAAGDPTRIKQILFNLLNNAIKFTPSGSVALRASASRAGHGHKLRLEVSDTGVGMESSVMERLFRRFEPGDNSLARRAGGSGLGLEISRSLARLMGGDITASSMPGAGSVFTATLLLRDLDAQDLAAATSPAPLADELRALRALRVLVADDHPTNRRFLTLALEQAGHTVLLAGNGEEAFEKVQSDPVDIILMDLHMPVMDGLIATREIRAMGGRHAQVPILVLSADLTARTRELSAQAGASAFLAKPVRLDELEAALQGAASGGFPTPVLCAGAMTEPVPKAPDGPISPSRIQELQARLPAGELGEMLRSFLDDDSRALQELRTLLAAGPCRPLHFAAHKVKGSARMLGLDAVAEAAGRIERYAMAEEALDGSELLRCLNEAVSLCSSRARRLASP